LVHDEIIDRILEQTDIVGVISDRIALKKAGRNYKTVCPFHNEKTPSFVVSPDKQIYHCFGCGAGGNAITFLMKHDGLEFPEALKTLADKANITLPARRFSDESQNSAANKLYQLNDMAKDFYKAYLKTPNGQLSYRYLKNRDISDEAIQTFELGCAPNIWDGLIQFFKKKGEDIPRLEKIGLVISRENKGGYYDRFRNRVIFPIYDIKQKVRGFGARSLSEGQPKYINSPETPIYQKGRHLYGLNFTKGFIKEKDFAIIVEGYLDLIIPYQHGVKNIVATLGTALTTEQIRLLKRFSKTVVIVFDADNAGQEASLRGLDLLISSDMNVRIATLPEGYDPDSYVRKHGAVAFEAAITSSKDLFDYKMGLLMKRYNKDGVRGRAAIATLMLPTISRIPNEILKFSFLKKMSDMLSIDESALKTELRKVKIDYSYSVPVSQPRTVKKSVSYAELLLLSIVLDNPKNLTVISEMLGTDHLREIVIQDILKIVEDMCNKGMDIVPGRLIEHFKNDEEKRIIAEAVGISETMVDKEKALFDCIQRIKEDNFKGNLNKLREEIRFAQDAKNRNRVNDLVSQYNELLKTHKG